MQSNARNCLTLIQYDKDKEKQVNMEIFLFSLLIQLIKLKAFAHELHFFGINYHNTFRRQSLLRLSNLGWKHIFSLYTMVSPEIWVDISAQIFFVSPQ